MSLQLLAKQMEAKGRKGDSMLVHMTPSEVEGLQKLAESMGETLTINPETGLVEAFSLKKLLPLLIGAGVTAATGGAAAPWMVGLGVGGAEALRTGNINKGLVAGLGAYGGAGLAGGLMGAGAGAAGTTAQAISNPALAGQPIATGAGSQASMLAAQNAGFGAEGTASLAQAAGANAPSAMAQMGQGFSGLSSQAGREAFLQNMGGYSGLAKAAGMAAAPMMEPEAQTTAEAPTDDEMFYYTYNPGRTGVERTPAAGSEERVHYADSFSPVRKIRASQYPMLAAQGGLMHLAEGGETAATPAEAAPAATPTASEAALSYLMGERSSSSAGLPAMAAQTPASTTPNLVVGSDNMYAFDPATGVFVRNPNYVDPTSGTRNAGLIGQLISGGSGNSNVVESMNPEWDKKTDAEKARYYRENPTMGAITQAAQKAFSFSPFAKAQEFMDPGYGERQAAIARGEFVDSNSRINSDGSYDYSGLNSRFGPTHTDYGDTDYDRDTSPSTSTRSISTNDYDARGGWGGNVGIAQGGLIGLAKGGMASGGFVVPADVVSALGNGSTDAGLRALNAMLGKINPIKGKGDGLSDSIPTHIDGKQPAKVADGEAYIDPKTVKRVGGAKKLYAMMDKIRTQAHGKTTQQRKVNPAKVMA